MNFAAHGLEPLVIMNRQGLVTLLFNSFIRDFITEASAPSA